MGLVEFMFWKRKPFDPRKFLLNAVVKPMFQRRAIPDERRYGLTVYDIEGLQNDIVDLLLQKAKKDKNKG